MQWLFFGLIALGLIGIYKSIISFPLFMVLILLLTGVIWLIDYLFFQKKRASDTNEPVIVEYAKSFFPVILLVFVIRSFIAEPFKIPSGSMMPTLLAGDYILVNKYTYGLRIPVINRVFFEMNEPERGDVAVFHFPPNPSVDYIKRIVGLPGDKMQFVNKRLIVNDKKVLIEETGDYIYEVRGSVVRARQFQEQIEYIKHGVLVHDDISPRYNAGEIGQKFLDGESIVVPEGHYFAMGDNRDNSSDGRVWGFVPDENLVGKAFFIWFNFDEFGRIGSSIH